MTNHVHLLGRVADDGSLSDAMHRLGSRYALYFNKATDRDGPLFTSRFHSTPIVSDAQLAQTARYIHRNPLAFVPARALAAYRWSSLAPIIGRRAAPAWLSTGIVAAYSRPEDYLSFVLNPQPADRFPFGTLPPLTPTTLDGILDAVTDVTGVGAAEVLAPRSAVADVRSLVIALATEMRVAGNGEIASRFGMSHARSVRRAARRARAEGADSDTFAALRRRVLEHLDRPRIATTDVA